MPSGGGIHAINRASLGCNHTAASIKEAGAAILASITAACDVRSTLAAEADAALARGRAKLAAYEAGLMKVMEQVRG